MTLCATRFVCLAKPPYGVLSTVYLKYAPKWTSAGRKDVISLPRNRTMCNRLQVITSLPVCAKRAVTYVTSLEQPFLGLSPWRDVMCDTLCMLGEAAVRGLIDCIFNVCT